MLRHVLIVDEDAHIRQILKYALTHEGYSVETASNSFETLVLLTDRHQPDMVIVGDLKPLPETSLGLVNDIRVADKWRHLPILMLSTQLQYQDVVNGMMFGANWYLGKPFKLDDLISTIEWMSGSPSAA